MAASYTCSCKSAFASKNSYVRSMLGLASRKHARGACIPAIRVILPLAADAGHRARSYFKHAAGCGRRTKLGRASSRGLSRCTGCLAGSSCCCIRHTLSPRHERRHLRPERLRNSRIVALVDVGSAHIRRLVLVPVQHATAHHVSTCCNGRGRVQQVVRISHMWIPSDQDLVG